MIRAWITKVEGIGKRHPIFFPAAIALIVFAVYLLMNIGITGPQYLSDEVGYLNKASTIAGRVVHASTSWNAGYPILLSPAFFLFANPYTEWQAVLVINAILWAISALLLYYVIKSLYPKTRKTIIAVVTLASFAYPAYVSMSGYAFATTGFVCVFMAALAALIKSEFKRPGWLVLAVLLAGYLYWIHPLGGVFVFLLSLLLIVKSIIHKKNAYFYYGIVPIAMAGIYQFIVKPILDTIMIRGGGAVDTHYDSTLHQILSAISTPNFFIDILILLVGLVLYICIATFGIAIYAVLPYFKKYLFGAKWKELLDDPKQAAVALTILSVIATIFVSAISTAGTSQIRADQWIYGRYSEMFLLPLISIGLLSLWKFRTGLYIAAAAVLGGILFAWFTNPTNTALTSINEVNIQAFWPLIFLRHSQANYLFWFCLGAIGIAGVGLLGTSKRKIGLLILTPLLLLTVVVNMGWHRGLLKTHSSPSTMYQTIIDNYPSKTCIGYTTAPDIDERLSLYSYYLHNYDLRPMTYQAWLKGNCAGPYLTFALDPSMESETDIIGHEVPSSLYLIVKETDSSKIKYIDTSSSFVAN